MRCIAPTTVLPSMRTVACQIYIQTGTVNTPQALVPTRFRNVSRIYIGRNHSEITRRPWNCVGQGTRDYETRVGSLNFVVPFLFARARILGMPQRFCILLILQNEFTTFHPWFAYVNMQSQKALCERNRLQERCRGGRPVEGTVRDSNCICAHYGQSGKVRCL